MLGNIQEVEGRTFVSVSKKTGRDEYREVRDENSENGERAVQSVTKGSEIRVAHGRTVNLGNYESARITVSYSAVGSEAGVEKGMEKSRIIVMEALSREVCNLSQKPHTKKELGLPIGEAAKIGVDYGLTLNLGNFESAKVDVGVTIPIPDGSTVDEALVRLSEILEKRIKAEVDAIRGLKGADDIGI